MRLFLLLAALALLLPLPAVAADADGDGVTDLVECGRDGVSCASANRDCFDTDLDALVDACDPDDDGDGIPTSLEGQGDPDRDGTANYRDDDSDGDGVLDEDEGFVNGDLLDADCDNQPDFLDPQNDGPCISRTRSGVAVTPATAPANGVAALRVTITLRAEDGSTVGAGFAVVVGAVFEEPLGLGRINATATFDAGSGSYQAELRSSAVGSGHLEVQVGALTLAAQPPFAFLAADALDPVRSELVASPLLALGDGATPIDVAVTLRNVEGTPLAQLVPADQLFAELVLEPAEGSSPTPARVSTALSVGLDGVFRGQVVCDRPADVLIGAAARGPGEPAPVALFAQESVTFTAAVFLSLELRMTVDHAERGELVTAVVELENGGRGVAEGHGLLLVGSGLRVEELRDGADELPEEAGRFALPPIPAGGGLSLVARLRVTDAVSAASLAATLVDRDGAVVADPREARLSVGAPPFALGCALTGTALLPLLGLCVALRLQGRIASGRAPTAPGPTHRAGER